MIARELRVFSGFDAAERADDEYYASLTPQERLDILLDIIAAISGETPERAATGLTSYGALKAACVDHVVSVLEPIQRRYAELAADQDQLEQMLRAGAERAREQADGVLGRARAAMGLPQL